MHMHACAQEGPGEIPMGRQAAKPASRGRRGRPNNLGEKGSGRARSESVRPVRASTWFCPRALNKASAAAARAHVLCDCVQVPVPFAALCMQRLQIRTTTTQQDRRKSWPRKDADASSMYRDTEIAVVLRAQPPPLSSLGLVEVKSI